MLNPVGPIMKNDFRSKKEPPAGPADGSFRNHRYYIIHRHKKALEDSNQCFLTKKYDAI